MSTAHTDPPIARMTTPGEIVAVVPTLCGFVPQESLVLIALRGERQRLGLTLRCDLPRPDREQRLAEGLVDRLATDGARAVLALVYTEQGDAGPEPVRAGLVAAVEAASRARGLELQDALLVRAGRWRSYTCREPSCCPPDGVPVDVPATPALQLVSAEAALQGRAVLPSRDDLVRSVAAPRLLAAAQAEQHLDRAAALWLAALRTDSPRMLRREALRTTRALLDRPGELQPAEAAALAVALHDVLVRDEIATWALDRPDALLALLLAAVRQVVPPYDAPLCSLLAWVAYAAGDGGLANVALDRALASDPQYNLARLLRQCLDGSVGPDEVRAVLLGARSAIARGAPRRRARRRA